MVTPVDTNVILDVLADDPVHARESEILLVWAIQSGSLVISEVVYAELAPQYDSRDLLDHALERLEIRIVDGGGDIAWLAGSRWKDYRTAGGTRQRMLADFLIGARAVLRADCLLTRDRGFYGKYFPGAETVRARVVMPEQLELDRAS